MPLFPGTRFGPYEITAPLGAGGMGEVYGARDTLLKRDVALKVLPAALAHDPERMTRFQREAELLASLNHPNIAIIHGLVESVGQRALVMELVPGETLAARMTRGAMPASEALPIARQIAEALEAAHERGVVHRDLKPGNVMITPTGLVKVLDFGLAAIVPGAPSTSTDPANSPTLTVGMTQAGVILGTAAYMSPEQAAGTAVDRRADIWSYGVVLWEMLSGQRLFVGDTTAHTLADVLRGPIDFDRLTTLAPIKTLLRRCLDRDAKTRLRDIGEARVAIATVLAAPDSATKEAAGPEAARQWVAWAAAAVLALLAAIGWLRPRPEQASAAADLALTIAAGSGTLARVGGIDGTPQISPDGSAVVFQGPAGLHVRRLNALDPEPVRASGLTNPGFWSTDSKTYVFADADSLRKVRVPDGATEFIAKGVVGPTLGGGVSDNGTIIFSAVRAAAGLYTTSATGNEIKAVQITGGGQGFWPEFLPDGEDFLFLHNPVSEERGIYLATLRDGHAADPVLLMRNDTAASYTPSGGGRLLFVRDDSLYAQRLNRTARKLEGEPELIQRGVASSPAFFRAHFSVSRSGVLAWRPGRAGLSQVTVLDRQGNAVGTAGLPTLVQTLRLAPDETRLLLGYFGAAWLLEPGQSGLGRVEQGSWNTLWSPDGSKFVEVVPGAKGPQLVERPVGGGAARDLPTPSGLSRPLDLSPDGKTLLFNRGALDTAVFSVRLDDSQNAPQSLVQTGEAIAHAHFSPDGRWIVYAAESPSLSGPGGIYVQPFPGPGLRTQIASSGNYPVWRKDGREIVYLDQYQGRDYLWSVPVVFAGKELHPGAAAPLFPVRLPASTFGDLNFLAASRDGSRFYIPQAVEQPVADLIHVRMGWTR
jgi:hypothetical protein